MISTGTPITRQPPGGFLAGIARPELSASPEWLAENLDRPDVRILDVRWRPDGTAATLYGTGHVPGAVHLDWRSALVAPGATGDTLLLAPPTQVAAVLSRAGVGDGTSVVLYDDTLSYYAARAWWSLRVYGLESVRILEGGYPAWLDAGYPAVNGAVAPTPAAV
jgi:thiosulfate/3-mercaptopyruvate sulfurtransferase